MTDLVLIHSSYVCQIGASDQGHFQSIAALRPIHAVKTLLQPTCRDQSFLDNVALLRFFPLQHILKVLDQVIYSYLQDVELHVALDF